MKTESFSHGGNCGDVIYSLSVIQNYCNVNDCKAVLYLKLDRPSTFTDKTHPVGNVMLNKTMYDMLVPLLLTQDYIEAVYPVEKNENAKVTFDLDLFRTECKNLSGGDIKQWYSIPFPELKCIPNHVALEVEPIKNDFIIINRTHRYNNPLIDYTILKGKGKLMFVGVENEYKVMKAIMPEVEWLKVKDFKELAGYIKGCNLFVGNQSMAFAIAEQLKVSRVLEQYFAAPNVIPSGGEWYAFHTQKQFENIIQTIYGRNK